jgi:tetratricopeptide (TPR) repeat protein
MRAKQPVRLAMQAFLVVLFLGFATVAARAEDQDTALREQALKLNDVTGDAAIQKAYQALVASPTSTKKLLAVAAKMAKDKDKEKDQPFGVNATHILAKTAQALRDYDTSEQFYKLFEKQAGELQSLDKISQVYSGLSSLYYDMKKYEKCEELCREFLGQKLPDELASDQIKRTKVVLIRRLVMTLTKEGKSDESMKIVDGLLKDNADNWLLNELKGWVLREDGKFDEAVKVYEAILAKINDDKDLTRDEKRETGGEIRYILSNVYVENKQIDKAAEQLKTLLEAEPNNPTYNNDLGFIWADNDKNLEESEKLIRKALEEDRKQRRKDKPEVKPEDDKDNGAYLDSLGWVLFKQKKYDEAKKYLEQATQQTEGQHIEIFDHLGDAYMALGDKAKALEAWKKGVEHPGDNKRDKAREIEMKKKIKANEQ